MTQLSKVPGAFGFYTLFIALQFTAINIVKKERI
jgi:hypothetical protein